MAANLHWTETLPGVEASVAELREEGVVVEAELAVAGTEAGLVAGRSRSKQVSRG